MANLNEVLNTIHNLNPGKTQFFTIAQQPVTVTRSGMDHERKVESLTGCQYKVYVMTFAGIKTHVLCEPYRSQSYLGREITRRLRVLIYENTDDVNGYCLNRVGDDGPDLHKSE